MQGNPAHLPEFIQHFHSSTFTFRERDLVKCDSVDGTFSPVKVADLEFTPPEFPVVSDATQELVNGLHNL